MNRIRLIILTSSLIASTCVFIIANGSVSDSFNSSDVVQVRGGIKPGGPIEMLCPADVHIGIINPPANWSAPLYTQKLSQFEKLEVMGDKTKNIVICLYKDGWGMSRAAPEGYECKRVGPANLDPPSRKALCELKPQRPRH